ncbi:MAG: peptidoglycan DD-metalloendopeptidase family protein [Bacillota bacterium]|nr:peptidoglycan DD-metalloendopeptidase family protein [Bacillota bacterium]
MKKKCISLLMATSLMLGNVIPVHAEEDFSNEEYWYSKCTQAQTSQEGVDACVAFQEYQQNKKQNLENAIQDYTNAITSLEKSIEEVILLASQQRELAASLQAEIAVKEAYLESIQAEIERLIVEIRNTQKEIDLWDAQIKKRMRNEQGNSGTNVLIDLIMGSQDLNDMIRRITGIERITEGDKKQIEQLNVLKAEIEFQKSEQERLEGQIEEEKQNLEEQRAQAQALQESYEQLEQQYHEQIKYMEAAKREAQKDISEIRDFVISADFSANASVSPTEGWVFPVTGGGYSAGTWAYPDGYMHLGLDWAAPIGTIVVAPANGLILYANNPVPSDCGYLGNYIGWPLGGGNTIAMVCQVNGTTYAITFAHLAQEGFAVSTGQEVGQGQQIAAVGNSGNSTGAHCHIEVFDLGGMSISEVVANFSGSADFSFGSGWYGIGYRVRPEAVFGIG